MTEPIAFNDDQIQRLGHWLSECLDDDAPLNEHLWVSRARWMVNGPTFQGVLSEKVMPNSEAENEQLREQVGC